MIRTKRVAQLGRDVDRFGSDYERYFAEHAARSPQALEDARSGAAGHPRSRDLGVVTIGRTAQDAAIAFDVYAHTIDIVLRATALGGYRALPAADIFAVEYWDLEQAKLRAAGQPADVRAARSPWSPAPPRASAKPPSRRSSSAARPSSGWTSTRRWPTCSRRRAPTFWACSATSAAATDLERALDATVRTFGGLDMLVLNAGIFPSSRRIEALPLAEWRRVMDINLDANLALLERGAPAAQVRAARRAGAGHRLEERPGAGSRRGGLLGLQGGAEPAGARRGARVGRRRHPRQRRPSQRRVRHRHLDRRHPAHARRELRPERGRVPARTTSCGVEVTSRDVAELVAEMCGPLFSPGQPAPRCPSTAATTASFEPSQAALSATRRAMHEPVSGLVRGPFHPARAGPAVDRRGRGQVGHARAAATRARSGPPARGDVAEPARARLHPDLFRTAATRPCSPSQATTLCGRQAWRTAGRSSRTTRSSLTVRWPSRPATRVILAHG